MMRKQWNGIWVTELASGDGAQAVIADHGAHVLSWTPASGGPALYMSDKSGFGGNAAIRGGVPIIFPQFGERGTGKRHGFARVAGWEALGAGIEDGSAVARYRLMHEGDAVWPHRAELTFTVTVSGQELQLALEVDNSSRESWQFCAALHTYLQVADIARVTLVGLQHVDYLDQVRAGMPGRQEEAALAIDGEIDRIYAAVAQPLTLDDGMRRITIDKQGFTDVVVWNPGAAKAAALNDMPAQDYQSFLCVEAGIIMQPVVLQTGASWRGVQRFTMSPRSA
jgi:glucose-6-phosphate 1-epimerase